MSKYENYEICKKCNGSCCRSGGCIIAPQQFKEFNIDVLKEIMSTNIVTIDWWEGDPREDKDEFARAYYLRMRETGDDWFFVGSWGKQCILHDKFGKCPIDINHRPYEAAYMIPNPKRIHPDATVRFYATCNGDGLYIKNDIAIEYLKYDEVFQEFEEYCQDIDYVDFIDYEKGINKYLEIIKFTNFDEES